ncbi:MAG: lipopolysaccharide biosynthesis protein [Candidatus Helarchaeota archaeon]
MLLFREVNKRWKRNNKNIMKSRINLILYIKTIINRKISKNIIFIFIGNLIYAFVSFINQSFLAVNLGPSKYGNFSLLYAILNIILILSSFGLDISFVRFGAEYYSNKEMYEFIQLSKFTLKIRIITLIFIVFFGIIFSPLISKFLLKNELLISSLTFIFLGSFGYSLFEFIKTFLQSKQDFKKYIICINLYIFLILFFLFILKIFSALNLLNSVLVFSFTPYIVLLISSFFIKFNFFKKKNKKKIPYKKILFFNIYIIISNICSMFFNRIDIFYLNFFLSPIFVGYYSVSFQIANIITIITNSLTFILLPKISSLKDLDMIRSSYKKILIYCSILYLFIIPIIFLAPFLIQLVYTKVYNDSIPIFQILILSIGTSLIINPLSTILYRINQPKVLMIIIIIELLLILILEPFFIIIFQIYGVVLINIINHLIALLGLIIYLYFKLYKK